MKRQRKNQDHSEPETCLSSVPPCFAQLVSPLRIFFRCNVRFGMLAQKETPCLGKGMKIG
jgi:hypothetical protein